MSDLDRELDRLLREMRDEEVPEWALEAARSGTRARIAAGGRRRAAWTWLSLAAVAAMLWLTVAVFRERPVAQLPVVALRTPRVPEAEFQRGVGVGGTEVPRGLKSAPLRAGGTEVRPTGGIEIPRGPGGPPYWARESGNGED